MRALTVACALALSAAALAGPTDLLWRSDAAAMAAGGSYAPPAVLGETRPDFPTSLADAGAGIVAAEVSVREPLTLRRGRREFGEITGETRVTRMALPVAEGWHAGWSISDDTLRTSHRLRTATTRAEIDTRDLCVGAAWSDGPWTLGVAECDRDLRARASGSTIADLQGVAEGAEGITLSLGGAADTLGVQYASGGWLAGVRYSERDADARLPVEIDGSSYAGVFSGTERHFDAWLIAERGRERWFAYLADVSADPGPGALFAGTAVRGRLSLGADSTAIGVGRRRAWPGGGSHLELSRHDDSADLSGHLNRGALGGGLTGQDTVVADARLRTWAVRWTEEHSAGLWHYRWGATAMVCDLDFEGRHVGVPGPLQAPDARWERRLEGGGAWLAAAILGGGREVSGWRIDGTLALLTGDTFGDIIDPAAPETPAPAQVTPEPEPTGPGMRLDLGWLFSLRATLDL